MFVRTTIASYPVGTIITSKLSCNVSSHTHNLQDNSSVVLFGYVPCNLSGRDQLQLGIWTYKVVSVGATCLTLQMSTIRQFGVLLHNSIFLRGGSFLDIASHQISSAFLTSVVTFKVCTAGLSFGGLLAVNLAV